MGRPRTPGGSGDLRSSSNSLAPFPLLYPPLQDRRLTNDTALFTAKYVIYQGDRGSTVVKVLCLQIGRSLVRSQLVSVDFSLT